MLRRQAARERSEGNESAVSLKSKDESDLKRYQAVGVERQL